METAFKSEYFWVIVFSQNFLRPRSRKTNLIVITHKWLLDIKRRKTSLWATTPEKLDNSEDTKRYIHGST